jgi:hypothetical protein
MPLAFIHFLDGANRPVDPGFGVDQGGNVDNTLPVPNPDPGKPGHLPSVPPGWPIIPSHPIARPPRPVDPGYGVSVGGHPEHPIANPPAGQPGHLPSVPPGWPIVPSHPIAGLRPPRPDHGLPGGEDGSPEHPIVLPPTVPTVPAGSYLVLVRNPDGTWAYKVVAGPRPEQGLPTPPVAQPKS